MPPPCTVYSKAVCLWTPRRSAPGTFTHLKSHLITPAPRPVSSLLNGLPRWDDWFGQFGIKVSSGALRIVILVKNHPSDVYVGLTLDDYHPLGGQGALISGQYTCTNLMHMYVHGGEIHTEIVPRSRFRQT